MVGRSVKSEEEKVAEADEIGYKVIGRLTSSENIPFKPYEPYFTVGSDGPKYLESSLSLFIFLCCPYSVDWFPVPMSSKSAMHGDSVFTERLNTARLPMRLVPSNI